MKEFSKNAIIIIGNVWGDVCIFIVNKMRLFRNCKKIIMMKPKFVYKYRGGDKLTFKRDLDSIEENCFYAPNCKNLNDPCEALVHIDRFNIELNFFSKLLRFNSENNLLVKEALNDLIGRSKETGVYSLSETYKDELLWAHYANSHYGFCIEYNSNILVNTYKTIKYFLQVSYSNYPPQIGMNDISKKELLPIIKKIVCTKSKQWNYEKEHRLIIDSFGEREYYFEAVKSIYFGLRMKDRCKKDIMDRLKGRGINYYQMIQVDKTYRFEAKPVDDINDTKLTYFKEIPASITGTSCPVKYAIDSKTYSLENGGEAEIRITLESKIDKKSIYWLAEQIKAKIFKKAKTIKMFYDLKGEKDLLSWATSHFSDKKIKVLIQFAHKANYNKS